MLGIERTCSEELVNEINNGLLKSAICFYFNLELETVDNFLEKIKKDEFVLSLFQVEFSDEPQRNIYAVHLMRNDYDYGLYKKFRDFILRTRDDYVQMNCVPLWGQKV